MCTVLSALPFLTESLRRLRWCACDSTSTRQFAPVSSLSAVREFAPVSRPEGLAFRRLSIEERDEVVAALVAEFKAGERKELCGWHAGRGVRAWSAPFPGWEDWVREGRLLLWEEDLEELRSGAGGAPGEGAGSLAVVRLLQEHILGAD